jgi:zinc protease
MPRRGLFLALFLGTGPLLPAQQAPPPNAASRSGVAGFESPSALARIVRDTTLGNGLEVISIENHTVPLATVEVVVRTGAFTQEPGTEGVPHLFEHMLFRSFNGADDESFGHAAGDLHAINNGTTQEEQVSYYVTLPSSSLDRAIDLMAQLVRDPVFTQETLNEERQVVLNEFDRNQSDPQYRLERSVEEDLWTTGWGRKNKVGEVNAINAATPKLLRDIYRQYYIPNNAALIVSGDVSAAQVVTGAERHFGGWRRGADPFATHPIPAIPPLTRSTAVTLEDDVRNVTVRIEWQGPSASRDLQGTYAADVLGSVVDASGSTFQRRLVDSGLFTSVILSYQTLDHVGPITLYATTATDSLPRALPALARAIDGLGGYDAFSDDELTNSKRSRAVDAAFELDYPTEMAHTVGYWWSVLGLGYYMDYTSRMAAVTRADLRRYVDRYLHGAPAVVGVLVPRGDSAAVQASVGAFLHQLSGATVTRTGSP